MKSLIAIIVTTALVNNVVLSQFLGICSFLGVSSQKRHPCPWAWRLLLF